MRYFASIQYNGRDYFGWQRQPNQPSIQEEIESLLSTVLRQEIQIVGCGRTDTGVHASNYYFHFDAENVLPEGFAKKISNILPSSIRIIDFFQVEDEAHARFDATSRAYIYILSGFDDPFRQKTSYYFPFYDKLDFEKMQEAAALLLSYEDFFPFCKTNTDVQHYKCQLTQSEWRKSVDSDEMTYHVSANRFLRGMVRLIVGMCLNVGLGKTSIEEVKSALDNQTRLDKALSVSPHGLYLSKVEYPYIKADS